MPIHGYSGFVRMTTLCKTYVPQEIKDRLEPIKVINLLNIYEKKKILE